MFYTTNEYNSSIYTTNVIHFFNVFVYNSFNLNLYIKTYFTLNKIPGKSLTSGNQYF